MSANGAPGDPGFMASATGGGPAGAGSQGSGDGGDGGLLLPGVMPEKALGGAFAGGVVAAFLVRWLRS